MKKQVEAMNNLRAFLEERLHKLEVETVLAIVGLIGAVIHADGRVEESELVQVRKELKRLPVLGNAEIEQIIRVLPQINDFVDTKIHAWSRLLRESTSRATRFDILEILLEIAASDDEIVLHETNLMRRLVKLLGLTQDDYATLQTKHREKLTLVFDPPDSLNDQEKPL